MTKIIGQKTLLSNLDKFIDNDLFPHFIILIGQKGSGKKLVSKYIAEKLNATYCLCDIKVDAIREVIDTAYTIKDKTVYCIADADTMRNEAKNAMLKITEESPKNAYFILTVSDSSFLLDTIKSRAQIFYLNEYSKNELKEYLQKLSNNNNIPEVVDIARTPYEVDYIIQQGKSFFDYVQLVIDNIAEVESANAFKSSNRLALKNEEDKYDLSVFWKIFIYKLQQIEATISNNSISNHFMRNATGIYITCKYLNRVNKLGANKTQLYDMWVLDIREAWS